MIGSIFSVMVVMAAIFMIMPAYWYSYAIKGNLDNQIAFSEATLNKLDVREITSDINELKNKMKILENRKESLRLNTNLRSVLEERADGVRVERIDYKRNTQSKKDEISLWGVADTRENLISYADALETKFGKENIESPISNLLNKFDTDFVLHISASYEK